jgi:hypothetical protein
MRFIGNITVASGAPGVASSNLTTGTPFVIPPGTRQVRFYSSDAAATYEWAMGLASAFQVSDATIIGVSVAAGAVSFQTVETNAQLVGQVLSVRNLNSTNFTLRVWVV